MRSNSATPFRLTAASVFLDAIRGIAALLVCIGHWRYFFFYDYSQLHLHRSWYYVPYVMCSLGGQAVMIFFVLSGYLVGGHILRALDSGKWSWGNYLLQRGVRLWIVLLPALALGGILDFVALHFHLAPALYAGQVGNHLTPVDVHTTFSWKILLGNCFFLQTIAVPVFGSNRPLWSLANEFWYYLIFPLGLLALRRYYSIAKRVLMGIACLAILYAVGPGIRKLLLVWLIGVLLAIMPVRRTSTWLRWLALALYCPFFVAVSRSGMTGRFPWEYALGIATFAFLYVLLGATQRVDGQWYEQPSRTMAGFSYTLYLVHAPMLMILTALILGDKRWPPDARHLAIGFAILLAIIFYAYVVGRLTEFRTDEIRGWIKQRLRKPSTHEAAR